MTEGIISPEFRLKSVDENQRKLMSRMSKKVWGF